MSEFSYVLPILARLSSKFDSSDYKLLDIRGIPQNPSFIVSKFEDIIDSFQTRDQDVFVSTFVKAGTTWTQQIIHQLLRDGEPGGFYGETVPWLEATASDFLQPREAPTWTLDKINDAPTGIPRYFKTHATVNHLPRGSAKIKVIYVARNPKDTAVSLYHHAKSKPEFGYTGDFTTFCEIFLAGKAENGSWFDHVIDWFNECKANPDTHLFLQYEEMYQDNRAAIKKIAKFLNISCTDDALDKIVKNCTITEMRETSSFGLNHLRQGGYGNWRGTFSVALSEFFDDVYKNKMADSNLTFNFGPNSIGVDQIF